VYKYAESDYNVAQAVAHGIIRGGGTHVVARSLGWAWAGAGAGAGALGRWAGGRAGGPLRFTQRTASRSFDLDSPFGGRSISQVARSLRSGELSPADVRVEFIVRGGNRLIVNTRSSLALRQGGIPEAQWNLINKSGHLRTEWDITDRLLRNNLPNAGTEVLRITGSGQNASTYLWP
jgi:hypothetical protein